jgi:hypothetical protein
MPDDKAELRIETVPNPGRQSSRTAFRSASGMFAKGKPKAPSLLNSPQLRFVGRDVRIRG